MQLPFIGAAFSANACTCHAFPVALTVSYLIARAYCDESGDCEVVIGEVVTAVSMVKSSP